MTHRCVSKNLRQHSKLVKEIEEKNDIHKTTTDLEEESQL